MDPLATTTSDRYNESEEEFHRETSDLADSDSNTVESAFDTQLSRSEEIIVVSYYEHTL